MAENRRHRYSFRFKKEAILTLERNGGNVASTARECKVSPQNIIRWRKKKDEIFNANEPEPPNQEDENNDTGKGKDNDATIY